MRQFVIEDGRVVVGPDEEWFSELWAAMTTPDLEDAGLEGIASGEITIDPICDETGVIWTNTNVQN